MHVDDGEMSNISNALDRPLNILDELDNFPTEFKPLSESELYVSALEIMNRQIISITQSINNLKRIIDVQTEQIFQSEMFLAKTVDSISLPVGEQQQDSSESRNINDYNVSNTGDGVSVTTGEELGDTRNIEMDTLSMSKENLTNQNKGTELNKTELDDYDSTEQQNLVGLNNNSDVKETEYLENYDSVIKEQLINPNT